MTKATRMSSVWLQMPFMHGEGGVARLRQLLPILARARAAAEHNRAVVLSSPDACKQLCALLGLTDIRHWSGYVPAPPPGLVRDKDMRDIGDLRVQLERLVKHAEAQAC